MLFDYAVVRSARKSIAISVRDGRVVVRAPLSARDDIIERTVNKHKKWIEIHLEKSRSKLNKMSDLSPDKIARLKTEAADYFMKTANKYSELMGIKHGRIKITSAKNRYGSCNFRGNICFSYRLMLYPEAAREYVVVHELAHILEMNHSTRFYKIVERYMPDYKQRKNLLD